jgi:NhaA family Na+:H+ antiporter
MGNGGFRCCCRTSGYKRSCGYRNFLTNACRGHLITSHLSSIPLDPRSKHVMTELQDNTDAIIPAAPIDRVVAPITRFLHIQVATGFVLLICSGAALILANSPAADIYHQFWKTEVAFTFGDFEFQHSLKHLVNDGLMVIFFFVIGLEVKRELVVGDFRDLRRAALPIAAALGGMVAPALIYFFYLAGGEGQRGWGIPMATDIAFVVGCLALFGSRVPHSLRIMMLSLAIADDVGAILVIAVGYTDDLNLIWLIWGLAGMAAVSGIARLGVRSFPAYILLGIFVWFAFHESGIHATMAGVILGLMTPAKSYVSEGVFGKVLGSASQIFEGTRFSTLPDRAEKLREFQWIARETVSPLEYLQTTLHPWTGFVIMPIFALANAGVPFSTSELGAPVAIAAMLGLFIGKPLGIVVASWIAVKMGLARLPKGIGWTVIFAAGCVAGIGFTMALFIAELALSDGLLENAKIGVLAGSTASAILGSTLLFVLLPKSDEHSS